MYNETLAKVSAILVFVGFNMTFFTQFFLGSQGMPRRYYNYLDKYQPLHAFSSYGSWVYLAPYKVKNRECPFWVINFRNGLETLADSGLNINQFIFNQFP